MTLAAPLPGRPFRLGGITGYTLGKKGAPLLLVHSVNAAASAAEVRPVYEHFAATRRVFAYDMPGYGLSERADIAYTPRLMTDALQTVAAEVRRRCDPGRPVDAMAVSLGCEFLARAAVERPADWGRLAFVSPTGFNGRSPRRGAPGSTREIGWLRRFLQVPWAPSLFRGLTRPGVVRYFLERTWGGKQIDEVLWAYCVQTAREPGAHHAPLQFLSGCMFSADIQDVYERVGQPAWACHGVRGDFTDYRQLSLVSQRPNWSVDVFQAGALPYFERPAEFCAALQRRLQA
jgi:pimeloyl-ACP methyl ester carboxylesterase